MKNYNKYLKNKVIDINKLKKYGFILKENYYLYEQLLNDSLKLIIKINNNDFITKVYDINNDEEYNPIDIISFNGNYVGLLREKRKIIIDDIVNNCLVNSYNKKDLSNDVIKYIKDKYDSELEYLWNDLDAAIARNKNNNKWYLLYMKISKTKLGFEEDDIVSIINLKNNDNIVNDKTILKAYHMNKKKWITIILDNSISKNKVFELIDTSFDLVKNNK